MAILRQMRTAGALEAAEHRDLIAGQGGQPARHLLGIQSSIGGR
jgi:hypothetical protein